MKFRHKSAPSLIVKLNGGSYNKKNRRKEYHLEVVEWKEDNVIGDKFTIPKSNFFNVYEKINTYEEKKSELKI